MAGQGGAHWQGLLEEGDVLHTVLPSVHPLLPTLQRWGGAVGLAGSEQLPGGPLAAQTGNETQTNNSIFVIWL